MYVNVHGALSSNWELVEGTQVPFPNGRLHKVSVRSVQCPSGVQGPAFRQAPAMWVNLDDMILVKEASHKRTVLHDSTFMKY